MSLVTLIIFMCREIISSCLLDRLEHFSLGRVSLPSSCRTMIIVLKVQLGRYGVDYEGQRVQNSWENRFKKDHLKALLEI